MRINYTLILVVFLWFYTTESATLHWTGRQDSNWWTKGNWQCDGCVPTYLDNVIISIDNICQVCSKNVQIPLLPLARCLSLSINGTVSVNIGTLVVGQKGINVSNLSSITMANLTSQGDVFVYGNGTCNSGEIYGPGNYVFKNLWLSMCNIYTQVYVQKDVFLIPSTQQSLLSIHQNGWLIVNGSLVITTSFSISGNITAKILNFNSDKKLLFLTGNNHQYYSTIVVNGGTLTVNTPITLGTLLISDGTLDGIVDVQLLTLEKVLLLGNVSVSRRAYLSGPQTFGGNLRFKPESITNFNGSVHPYTSKAAIINEGQWTISGFFNSSVFIGGNGTWNVNGIWIVQNSCNITGTINLKQNSVLKLDNFYNSYSFGTITGGSIIGVGNFTAMNVKVDSFFDKFSNLMIDSLSSINYTSCCGSKFISNLQQVNSLILEAGNYPFRIQNIMNNILYLNLSVGVLLEINENDNGIENLDFYGGSLTSEGHTIQCNKVNMIGTDKKQFHSDTILYVDILNWTECVGDCGISQWSSIIPIDCVCDCKYCNNCAPCLNGDCSPCSNLCTCGNRQSCSCNNLLTI